MQGQPGISSTGIGLHLYLRCTSSWDVFIQMRALRGIARQPASCSTSFLGYCVTSWQRFEQWLHGEHDRARLQTCEHPAGSVRGCSLQ